LSLERNDGRRAGSRPGETAEGEEGGEEEPGGLERIRRETGSIKRRHRQLRFWSTIESQTRISMLFSTDA
jgi:hypothetical protein